MPGKLEVWLSLERDWTISWFVLYNYQQNNKKSEKWSRELIIQELTDKNADSRMLQEGIYLPKEDKYDHQYSLPLLVGLQQDRIWVKQLKNIFSI